MGEKFSNHRIFLYAVIMLSVASIFVVLANYLFFNKIWQILTLLFVSSLFINAIQHFFSSIYFREMLPGSYTAISLVFPYSIIYIIEAKTVIVHDFGNLFIFLLVSIIFMFVLILISLLFGYFLKEALDKKNFYSDARNKR